MKTTTSLYYLATPAGLLLTEIGGGAGLFEDSESVWNSEGAESILTWNTQEDAPGRLHDGRNQNVDR